MKNRKKVKNKDTAQAPQKKHMFMAEDSKDVAVALQTKFDVSQHPVVFSAQNANNIFTNVASAEELDESVWVAHSNVDFFNQMTAEQFAKTFDSNFNKKFQVEEKSKIKHIYIVSCETGASNPTSANNANSLAQGIADQLFKKGYTNVVVHSIKSPPGTQPNENLRVNVTYQGGLVSKDGHVQAYTIPKDIEEKIEALKEEIKKLPLGSDERRKLIDVQRAYETVYRKIFIYTDDIKVVMGLNENTFSPKGRLANQPSLHPVIEQAIVRIQAKYDDLKSKKDNTRADVLQQLIIEIKKNGENWEKYIDLLRSAKKEVDKGNARKALKKSETKNLLNSLIEEGNIVKEKFSKANSIKGVVPNDLEKHQEIISTYESELAQKNKRVKESANDIEINAVEAIQALQAYHDQLNKEIKSRKKHYFSKFIPTKLKQAKMEKILDLIKKIESDNANVSQHIKDALKDKVLTGSGPIFGTRRAKNVLKNILNGNVGILIRKKCPLDDAYKKKPKKLKP